jgi:SNF2 family DNA or RNA helicase
MSAVRGAGGRKGPREVMEEELKDRDAKYKELDGLLTDMGVHLDAERLNRLLKGADFDCGRAVNHYFDRGVPTVVSGQQPSQPYEKKACDGKQKKRRLKDVVPSVPPQKKHVVVSEGGWSKVVCERLVTGHSTSSYGGYGEDEEICIHLSTTIAATASKGGKKTHGTNWGLLSLSSPRGLKGRLPRELCDFLGPLLCAKVIDVHARGFLTASNLKVFSEVFLVLRIEVRAEFFDLKADVGDGILYQAAFRMLNFALTGNFGPTAAAIARNDEAINLRREDLRTLYAGGGLCMEDGGQLPEAPDPHGLKGITLMGYQRQGLAWMLSREKPSEGEKTQTQAFATAALSLPCSLKDGIVHVAVEPKNAASVMWNRYYMAEDGEDGIFNPAPFYVNWYTECFQLTEPQACGCRGGILADMMGLGKTIQSISLILADSETSRGAVGEINPENSKSGNAGDVDHSGSSSNEDYSDFDPDFDAKQTRRRQKKAGPEVYRASCDISRRASRSTLIIVPMSTMSQWRQEFASHTLSKSLSVLFYYGDDRCRSRSFIAGHDVVLSTYGCLVAEMKRGGIGDHGTELRKRSPKKKCKSGLFAVQWRRVMLDEAHNIRNAHTESAKAAYLLESEIRWCITGTPIQNDISDCQSLLTFLRYEPWSDGTWWRRLIADPYKAGDPSAMRRMTAALSPVLLRRTRDLKDCNGNSIINLPTRHERVVELQFSPEEKEFYDALRDHSAGEFEVLIRRNALNSSYLQVLALLLRLRQACVHAFLVLGRNHATAKLKEVEMPSGGGGDEVGGESWRRGDEELNEAAAESRAPPPFVAELFRRFEKKWAGVTCTTSRAYVDQMIAGIEADGVPECPVCLADPAEAPVLTACAHLMCQGCIKSCIAQESLCPVCREPCSEQELVQLYPGLNEGLLGSTKVNWLLQEMDEMALANNGNKAVIFSQWTLALDIVQANFEKAGWKLARLDGSMSQACREESIKSFSTDPEIKIFLVSFRAGGVGLNLTAANYCVLLDPWYNPMAEDQAVRL